MTSRLSSATTTQPRTIEQLLMARPRPRFLSFPSPSLVSHFRSLCHGSDQLPIIRHPLASSWSNQPTRFQPRSIAMECWWLSSPPCKLQTETLSIAKPAFIAEPTNRIHGVVAILKNQQSHTRDWSDISAFVKQFSPTAHARIPGVSQASFWPRTSPLAPRNR